MSGPSKPPSRLFLPSISCLHGRTSPAQVLSPSAIIASDCPATVAQAQTKSRYSSSIFTVLVGQDEEALLAHESVLSRSPVLKAMCSTSFLEGTTRNLKLLEDEKLSIAYLIEFLYTGDLDFEAEGLHQSANAKKLASIYIAADKYQVPGLKDAIVRDLPKKRLPRRYIFQLAEAIYENTPESDLCFRLFFRRELEPIVADTGLFKYQIEVLLGEMVTQGGELAKEIFLVQRRIAQRCFATVVQLDNQITNQITNSESS